MQLTPKGFKKPTTGDPADLFIFVGENMDVLENELDKRPEKTFHSGTTPPANTNLLWIDQSS